VARRSRGE